MPNQVFLGGRRPSGSARRGSSLGLEDGEDFFAARHDSVSKA